MWSPSPPFPNLDHRQLQNQSFSNRRSSNGACQRSVLGSCKKKKQKKQQSSRTWTGRSQQRHNSGSENVHTAPEKGVLTCSLWLDEAATCAKCAAASIYTRLVPNVSFYLLFVIFALRKAIKVLMRGCLYSPVVNRCYFLQIKVLFWSKNNNTCRY